MGLIKLIIAVEKLLSDLLELTYFNKKIAPGKKVDGATFGIGMHRISGWYPFLGSAEV